jgi:hypothetical protein
VNDNSENNLFVLKPPKSDKGSKTYFYQSLFSITEAGMYIPFAAMVIVVWLISFCAK